MSKLLTLRWDTDLKHWLICVLQSWRAPFLVIHLSIPMLRQL
jgi:hypothetical protein